MLSYRVTASLQHWPRHRSRPHDWPKIRMVEEELGPRCCAPAASPGMLVERSDDVEQPDTLVLNLTFFGTMGVALLMFFVLFLLGVLTLVLAGLGRLAGIVLMTLFGKGPLKVRALSAAARDQHPEPRKSWRERAATLSPARLTESLRTAVVRHPKLAVRREPPVLAEDWASAVARADARATARAKAAAPEIKLSVRDLPDPAVPADKVFAGRIEAYRKVRRQAEMKVPELKETSDPAKITDREKALGEAIRALRAGAKQGDVFVPVVTT